MKMLINGAWCEASDKAVIEVCNSATQEMIDTVPQATKGDVERAIDAAQAGKELWKNTPVHERCRILYRCADAIDARREELARCLSTEMGKIIRESRSEIRVCAQIFRAFAEAAAHHYGKTMTDYQIGAEKDILFTRHEPLGVVACISPFNYPVELASQKIAAALAAGNAVIVKPATDNPLTLMTIIGICFEQGVPGSVLQVITGRGSTVGDVLALSPRINAISLTGSTEVGLSVAQKGMSTLKRVFMELGGNDPFIVLDDADLEKSVQAAVSGRLQNAGQTCCSPKRFIVHASLHDAFVQGVMEAFKQVKQGSPLNDDTEYGCLISPRAAQEVERQVQHTVEQGAKLICGGHAYHTTYFEPTILDQVTLEMDAAKDLEIFGPVFPIITFQTDEEAISIANATQYGLQGGVMTRSTERAMRIAAGLHCGGVVINASGNYRHLEQPFGGWKMSGLGREGVSVTLDEMSQEKTYILKNVL